MANDPIFENLIKERRLRRGWSQEELAQRAGLSRAGVSAIETGRLVPSAAAALAIAEAFGCRVEDIFRLRRESAVSPTLAWPAPRSDWRVWEVEVGGVRWLYPCEPTLLGLISHDGIVRSGQYEPTSESKTDPRKTLLVATCDPAMGLLARTMDQEFGIRLIPITRSSRRALGLLGEGLIHVAGIHLTRSDETEGNALVVRRELGPGYQLIRAASWEEGIAFNPALRLPSVRQAVRTNLQWVARESGSGARQCLDELLGDRALEGRTAADHRSVAEAIRQGWGDAGVCLRLVSEEAGLDFLRVREEAYDLCYPNAYQDDERIQALASVLRSPAYRRRLGELPGYGTKETGESRPV